MDPRTERKRVESLMLEGRWEEAAVVLNGIVEQQKGWMPAPYMGLDRRPRVNDERPPY